MGHCLSISITQSQRERNYIKCLQYIEEAEYIMREHIHHNYIDLYNFIKEKHVIMNFNRYHSSKIQYHWVNGGLEMDKLYMLDQINMILSIIATKLFELSQIEKLYHEYKEKQVVFNSSLLKDISETTKETSQMKYNEELIHLEHKLKLKQTDYESYFNKSKILFTKRINEIKRELNNLNKI
jgi:hypothetical protein